MQLLYPITHDDLSYLAADDQPLAARAFGLFWKQESSMQQFTAVKLVVRIIHAYSVLLRMIFHIIDALYTREHLSCERGGAVAFLESPTWGESSPIRGSGEEYGVSRLWGERIAGCRWLSTTRPRRLPISQHPRTMTNVFLCHDGSARPVMTRMRSRPRRRHEARIYAGVERTFRSARYRVSSMGKCQCAWGTECVLGAV